MRALILSCNTGEGHNSCAKAIKECFDLRDEYCRIDDALRFASKGLSAIVSKSHVFIYRHLPSFFRFGYRYVEQRSSFYDERSIAYKMLVHGSEKLVEFIKEERFDAVICTHPFAVIVLNAAIKKGNLTLHTSFVATDYTCSPTVEAGDLNTYFIPDDSLKNKFVEYGINENKIVSSGVPVRQMFFLSAEKNDAKKTLGIDPIHRHLLVMCGSMGCGPMKKLTSEIADRLTDDAEMTVVCGTNKSLRRYLQRKHGDNQSVHICGYVQDMSQLMDSADVYLTKPGGISITEAKVKRLPMVFVNAVAGCEEYNRAFFMNRGVAACADTTRDIAIKCVFILKNEETREQMSAALECMKQPNAAEFIYNYITQTPKSESGREIGPL